MSLVRTRLAYRLCIIFFLAAVERPIAAQPRNYEGAMIRNIQFDPREQPLGSDELHEILPIRINEPLRMADVRHAIERLFATGRYADIQVDAQPYRDGVTLTFITRNRWFVGGLSVQGDLSSPPNAGQIENAANLGLGQPFTESAVTTAVLNQRKLLENNGLFESRIQPEYDWNSTARYQQVNIGFDLDSGRRARFGTPVLTGDLKIDQKRILAATKFQRWLIRTWKPMTQTRIRQALDGVRGLYQKENRLEAKVSLESMRYDPETNQAVPTIRIDAGPRIGLQTIGANISKKKLQRYVPVYEEHAVDHDLLEEGARNLTDMFQSQGYFEAEVEFKEQSVINDKATIDFLINRGKRHKLVDVRITGNRYFRTDAIRERMFLRTANFLQFPHGRYSEALVRRDEDSISNLYLSNGFRDVKVTHQTLDDYQGRVGDIAVILTIEEGPQYFIENLQVEGIERLNREQLINRLSSVPGQPFSEFNVAIDRDTILAQYFEKGFPSATFEWSYKEAAAPHRIDLQFVIREGRQQFVREVVISGNRSTDTQLINRNITLNPGDPLSPTEMTETQRRLYGLGVFARVDTAIQNPDGDSDRKYVLYNVEEARRYSTAFGFGAELGRIGGCSTCLDAPAGTAGFSPRVSMDLTRNNLWGLTHSISLRTRASTYDQRALLSYTWPNFGGDAWTMSFTGLYQNANDVRTFSSHREEAAAQLNQRYSKDLTFFYRVAFRRVSVSDLKVTPFLIPTLSQPVRIGIASVNLVQDRRDDPLDPHKGIYNTVDLGLAPRALGSQRSFMRVLVRNSSYYQLGKRYVLARSTQFGDLYAFNVEGSQLDAIPLAERFFGGGGTSHRGFWDNQAGSRDPNTGFPLGGTALLFNQTELRFPLFGENIGGVLYHDMGNIYSSLDKISFRVTQKEPVGNREDFDYMVHAVGFGLRYRTPVGPLRVDLGFSLNPPSFFGFKGSQQDLINAGPDPCPAPSGATYQCVRQNGGHFRYFFSIGQTF